MSTDPENLLDIDPAGLDPADLAPAAEEPDVEEYRPDPPRPDLDGEANEADVVDQAVEVPELVDEDDYVAPEDELPDVPEEDVEG